MLLQAGEIGEAQVELLGLLLLDVIKYIPRGFGLMAHTYIYHTHLRALMRRVGAGEPVSGRVRRGAIRSREARET